MLAITVVTECLITFNVFIHTTPLRRRHYYLHCTDGALRHRAPHDFLRVTQESVVEQEIKPRYLSPWLASQPSFLSQSFLESIFKVSVFLHISTHLYILVVSGTFYW